MRGSPWGGSEELWSQAAIRLSRDGHEISASIGHWPQPDPAVERLRAAGCRVFERQNRRFLSLALKACSQDPQVWRAERFIRRESPDLVVISCGAFADDLWWSEACREIGVPYVVIAQAAAELWWPDDVHVSAIRSAYQAARAVFFVSRANLRLVERMLAGPIANAQVVWNPFNVDYNAVFSYPSTEPTFNLACVARLDPYAKGQDLLLEVLTLEKWRSRNLKVSFFGRGASAESLRALSCFYELNNVSFEGHIRNVHDIWKSNHILVLPSRLEGLPLALIEAMLCGRPAVVTNVAGNTEVLDDNETGFVAAAPTVPHIDEALERAWAHRCHWADMGREAARRIRMSVPEDPAAVFSNQIIDLAGRAYR
jgi:glycosyltransferase involved in cell wall biosynthesis